MPPRQPARRQALQIGVIVRSAKWRKQPRAAAVVKKAVRTAAKAVSTPPAELAIVLCDDSAIRALNRKWRGKNVPTNVLSFPAAASGKRRLKTPNNGTSPIEPRYLGDIVIAYETVAREAVAETKPFNHHLAHLAVHGFLHLLGYDHRDDREARRMERTERKILELIAVPDPYGPRDALA
jgi:probable rRNA maturation factor